MMKISWMILFLPLTVLLSITHSQAIAPKDEYNMTWDCGREEIQVSLFTPQSFQGILMASHLCSTNGSSSTNTGLSISLINLDNCNVTYEPNSDEYRVRVWLRSHPKLLLDSDKPHDISCPAFRKVKSHSPVDSNFRLTFEGDGNSEEVEEVIFGRPYTMNVHQIGNRIQPFLVTRCTATGGDANLSATIIDSRGCPSDNPLLTPFARSSDNTISTSRIGSMFRFSSTISLTFECSIQICDPDEICRPLCSGLKTRNEKDKVRSLLNTVEIDEDVLDEILVSVTVKIRDEITPQIAGEKAESGGLELVTKAKGCIWREEDLFVYACLIMAAGFVLGTLFNLAICCIWMKRKEKKIESKHHNQRRLETDYWIAEPTNHIHKNLSTTAQPTYYEITSPRRFSNASYASVKNRPTRPAPPVPHRDYGVPPTISTHNSMHASQLSDYAGSRASSDGREYASCGVTASTFLSHSTTVETDLDSPGSNQTVSYH